MGPQQEESRQDFLTSLASGLDPDQEQASEPLSTRLGYVQAASAVGRRQRNPLRSSTVPAPRDTRSDCMRLAGQRVSPSRIDGSPGATCGAGSSGPCGVSPVRLHSVFACSEGNTESLENVLSALMQINRPVSSHQFAHLGHNAPASLWSMVTRSHPPSTSLGAYDGSFAARLLEAVSQAREGVPVLLVAYDVPPPKALADSRPVPAPFASALVLAAEASTHSVSRLHVRIAGDRSEDSLDIPDLEALRARNPAARRLPLLRLIAAQAAGVVVLPYQTHARVRVEHVPC